MVTVDGEFLAASLDFIDRQHKAGKPFFCWFDSTRMHIYTFLKPKSKGKTGLGIVADGMTEFDGYEQRDLLAGTGPGKRQEYFYWTDDGNLAGLRYERWKLVFLDQRAEGLDVWQEPLVALRFPKLFDIKADPFERAQTDAGRN